MKLSIRALGLATAMLLAHSGSADELSYQGELRRDGTLFTGNATMHFALIDESGQILWSNICNSPPCSIPTGPGVLVVVSQGVFSVRLGSSPTMVPIPPAALAVAQTLRLRVWVNTGSGPEQLTDQPLSVVWKSQGANALLQLDGAATNQFALWDGVKLRHSPLLRATGSHVEVVGGELRVASSGVRFADGTVQASASPWSVMGSMASYDGGVKVGVGAPSTTTFLEVSTTRNSSAIACLNLNPAGVGITSSGGFVGVDGRATSLSGSVFGVRGVSDSTGGTSAGVFGLSTHTTGSASGVRGENNSPSGAGVTGVCFSSAAGTGVFGRATATSGDAYGVYGQSNSPNGAAVAGRNMSPNGAGVRGESQYLGVIGVAEGTSGQRVGVQAISFSTEGVGVLAECRAVTGSNIGVLGSVQSPNGWAGFFQGAVEGTTTIKARNGFIFPDNTTQISSGITSAGAGLVRSDNAVSVASAGITNEMIQTNAIDHRVMADGAIGSEELQNSAVTSNKIADGAVTELDLANSSVTSAKIQDGNVLNQDIANGAINDAKVSDVAWNKITGVPSAFPPTGLITGGDLAGSSYPNPTLGVGVVNSAKIVDNSVGSIDLASDAASLAKVSNGMMTRNGNRITVQPGTSTDHAPLHVAGQDAQIVLTHSVSQHPQQPATAAAAMCYSNYLNNGEPEAGPGAIIFQHRGLSGPIGFTFVRNLMTIKLQNGNVGIGPTKTNPAHLIDVDGGAHCTGTTWVNMSDKHTKENIHAVNGVDILTKVIQLPITSWNYKTDHPSVQHIGPMAQDFFFAFGLGGSDTSISTVDASGVALGAIQGLHTLHTEQADEIESLRAENRRLRERLDRIEEMLEEIGVRR